MIEYLRYNLKDPLDGNIVVVRAVPVAPAEVEAELVIMTMTMTMTMMMMRRMTTIMAITEQ